MTTPGAWSLPPTTQPLPVDPTAVVGRRIGAYVIDMIPMVAGFVIFVVLLFTNGTVIQGVSDPNALCNRINDQTYSMEYDPLVEEFDDDYFCMPLIGDVRMIPMGRVLAGFAFAAVGGIFSIANMYILQGITGATVGKYMLKLRVVTSDGHKVGFGRNLVRSLMFIADAFCAGAVGLITVLSTKRHQRVGDLCADTYVVHRDSVGMPIPQGFAMPQQTYVPQQKYTHQQAPPPVPAPSSEPQMPQGSQMQWDDRWKAWVYWDPTMQRWLRHDTVTNQWIVIPN